jgi:hypothetical protein
VVGALRQADLRWIAVGLAIYSCGFMTRATRWEKLMRPVKPIPASQLLRPMVIGFFANNVLPFRMGELVRAHVTGNKFGISRTAALGTIVLERIFDTISFLSIFLAIAFFFPFPDGVRHGAYVLGAGCAGLIAALVFASKYQAKTNALIARLPVPPKWQQKIQRLMADFTHGVSGMMHGHFVAQALVLSMAVWGIEGTTGYCIARAFTSQITYPQAYFVMFFLGLAVTLPQAPGYVGTMELFGVMAFSLLGIPKNIGLSIVLTLHGCQFVFIAGMGIWALWKENLSLSRLVSEEEQTL